MSLDNNSANNFKDFLDAIKPFLNYQLYDMSGMGVEAFQFSTDEKPVGQWTDGKLIYAKTFNTTYPSSVTDGQQASRTVAHGISNIDFKFGFGGTSAANAEHTWGSATNTLYMSFEVDTTNLIIKTNRSSMANQPCTVTLFYTKTTDSPLSSDEKFAGVTSGGKVIYEKTYSLTTPNSTSDSEVQSIGSGLNIIEIRGMIQNGTEYIPVNYIGSSSNWLSRMRVSNGKIYQQVAGYLNKPEMVTLRYTKSS